MPQTIADINAKIKAGKAKVLTATELKALVVDVGVTQATKQVDVIVTGTFEPMESSGAVLNLGHTDPPIKIRTCWIDGVPAYAGFGAVDIYLGATQEADPTDEAPQAGHTLPGRLGGRARRQGQAARSRSISRAAR